MNEDPRRSIDWVATDAAWRAEMARVAPAVSQEDTSVPLPEDGADGDPAAVSERLSEDLDIEVDLQFENAEYLAMMETELRRLDEYGLLGGLNLVTDVPTRFDHDLKDRASGLYNTATQELYVAPEEVIGEEPRERKAREGYFSTDKNFGSVWHELGHHWVREANPDADFEASENEDYWGQETMQRFAVEETKGWVWENSQDPQSLRNSMSALSREIEGDVSEYAAFGAMEFVAETFAGLVAGNEYPQWVMGLYGELGGYEPPMAARDPATAYVPMVAPSPPGPRPQVAGAAAAGAVEAAVHAQTSPSPEDIGDVGVWELGGTSTRIGGETYTAATWKWEDDEIFGETWAITAGVATDHPDTRTQVSLGNFDRLEKQTLYSEAAEHGKPFEFARRFMQLHTGGFDPGYFDGDVQDPDDQIHQDAKAIWEDLHGETEAAAQVTVADEGDLDYVVAQIDRAIAEEEHAENMISRALNDITGVFPISVPMTRTDGQLREMGVTLARAGSLGILSNVEKITRVDVSEPAKYGAFRYSDKVLELSGDFNPDDLENFHHNGEIVGDDVEWLVLHELGHAAHDERVEMVDSPHDLRTLSVSIPSSGDKWDSDRVRERLEIAEEEVSSYARTNSGEFVAEVFAGLCLGQDFPDRIMDMYHDYAGPDEWRLYREEFHPAGEKVHAQATSAPADLPAPLRNEAEYVADTASGPRASGGVGAPGGIEAAVDRSDPDVGQAIRRLERAGFGDVTFNDIPGEGGEIQFKYPAVGFMDIQRDISSAIPIGEDGDVLKFALRFPAFPDTDADDTDDVVAVAQAVSDSIDIDTEARAHEDGGVFYPHVDIPGRVSLDLGEVVGEIVGTLDVLPEAVESHTNYPVFDSYPALSASHPHPAANFGEWPWSRDKSGLKACEEEMAGEVDNRFAFCRAWANEAGIEAQVHPQADGSIMCVTGDDDLHPSLRAAAVDGEFDGGTVSVETMPVGDLGPWAEPGVPIADNPLMIGQGCTARMPVGDFRRLQTYIGTEIAPQRFGEPVSRDEFWGGVNPDRLDSIERVLRGEDEPKEIFGGVPMPYVQIGSDGTLRGVQEGRHRTVAAENAGLSTIPVRILYNDSQEGEGGPPSATLMSARSDGGRMESIRSQIDEAVVGAVPPEDTFSTEGEAQDRAGEIGCAGAHQMPDGNWMPCDTHGEYHDAKGIESQVSEIEYQIEASIGQELPDHMVEPGGVFRSLL